MTDLAFKLQEVMNDVDITTFVWKLQTGSQIKLIDCDESDLKKYWKHANDMLYNKSIYNPGKYIIKDNIQKLYNNCNAELFIRYVINECEVDSIKTKKDLLDFINEFKSINNISITNSITDMFNNIPSVFNKITIEKLLDGCLDKLDVINKKMISDKFILSQGVWFTDDEKEILTEYDESGKLRNRMEVVKERLVIKPEVKLRVTPNGLSYEEFRSMVQLPNLPKISSLPTTTLKTLRDKILILLDKDVDYHVNRWNTLKHQIEMVMEHRKIMI